MPEPATAPMNLTETTHSDFCSTSWHDNFIYGISISIGDIHAGDWRSDLVFDIDHIVEWVAGTGDRPRFRVAPATLLFHHVTDLKLAIDWGSSGYQTALHEASIDQVARVQIFDQKICLDRPYYHWQITMNFPAGGEISFGASGYTQTLRSGPVLQDEQKLSPRIRAPFSLGS